LLITKEEKALLKAKTVYQKIEDFVNSWQEDSPAVKGCFVRLVELVRNLDGVDCTFIARFMILDVIDDDPDARWLSVCFYSDLISDVEERGEVIPGGLAGSDGYCFNLFDDDKEMAEYLEQRCIEACRTIIRQAIG
jgi:hypothetical protein